MKWPWTRQQADLDREVAYHLASLADAYQAEGISREEAMKRARREFGGVDQVKEQCRDESRWAWLMQAGQDLRFGWRMICKSPSISVAAVVSLALGIGATTAIYSFAHAVLWRKLAVPAPEQMIEVQWEVKKRNEAMPGWTSGSSFPDGGVQVADFFSAAAFDRMREQLAGKLAIAAHIFPASVSASVAGNVTVTKLRGVSENFFDVLRIRPQMGRLLSGEGPQVVVSHRFWGRALGGRRDAVGRGMRINNYPYTIVGVLPREFFGLTPGDEVELYTLIAHTPALLASDSWYRPRQYDPNVWWMQLIARRAPGVSLEEARAAFDATFAATWPARPPSAEQTPRIRTVDASTGLGSLRRQFGDPAWILLALVMMVLVVACANIANLLLARAAERQKEVGLRISLGCDPGRLMRQFLTESLLLAFFGGGLSLAVALGIGSFMANVLPQGLDSASLMVDLSVRSVLVTAGVTLATALIFGLYPAWRAARVDVAPALREGSGSAGSASRARLVPARLLVVAQVALGVLLVMAGIVYTTKLNDIVRRDSGFERAHTLLFDLRPGELSYAGARLDGFYRDVEDRLRAIPGVTEVGFSRIRPMRGGGMSERISVPGEKRGVNSWIHHSTSGFTAALGVKLLAGRSFTPQEAYARSRVAIISEQIARDLGLHAPVGARILFQNEQYDVIGVAQNASYSRLTEMHPVTYLPLPKDIPAVTALVRTSANPLALVGAAREAVRSIDPNVPLIDVFTMEQQISRTLQRERMFAWLCGSFGVLALVLCVVGIYGLLSHATARRTPEIGIRMALGASNREVLRQVVVEGMRLAAAGMLLGIPLAWYGAGFAQRQKLLAEGPLPYGMLAAAVAVLGIASFLAVAGPARRASSVDPMCALRQG